MIERYGIDIGATTIKGSVIDSEGNELMAYAVATPFTGSSRDVEDAIVTCFELMQTARPGGLSLGLGAPGWVSADRKVVHYSPNLPWRNEPLAERLSARIGLPVLVENDANAAAWGEYRYGAGRGASSLLAVTLGSGVGGGVVLNGQLVRGHRGGAGEVGHCPVVTDGYPCACGRIGCLENYASGRAIERHSEFPNTSQLSAAAASGDERALGEYRRLGDALGRSLAGAVLLLNPELIIVGGAVADAIAHFGPAVELAISRDLASWSGLSPGVVAAQLGTAAGRIGAADLSLSPDDLDRTESSIQAMPRTRPPIVSPS